MKDDIQSILPIAKVWITSNPLKWLHCALWNAFRTNNNELSILNSTRFMFIVRSFVHFLRFFSAMFVFHSLPYKGSWIDEYGRAYGSASVQGNESIYCFAKWKGCWYNTSKFVPFRRRKCHKGMSLHLSLFLCVRMPYRIMIRLQVCISITGSKHLSTAHLKQCPIIIISLTLYCIQQYNRCQHPAALFTLMELKQKDRQTLRLLSNTVRIRDWLVSPYGCPSIHWKWLWPIFVCHRSKDGKFQSMLRSMSFYKLTFCKIENHFDLNNGWIKRRKNKTEFYFHPINRLFLFPVQRTSQGETTQASQHLVQEFGRSGKWIWQTYMPNALPTNSRRSLCTFHCCWSGNDNEDGYEIAIENWFFKISSFFCSIRDVSVPTWHERWHCA